MKIAVASLYDINNLKYWSGTINFMTSSLKNQDIELIQPKTGQLPYYNYFRLKSYINQKLLDRMYFKEREPIILKHFAHHFSIKLKNIEHDIIFSPQTQELLHVKTDKPSAFWIDATFDAIQKQLVGRIRMNRKAIELGNYTDLEVFRKSSACIFASDWAANSAIEQYGINSDKVHVVPFGANLNNFPDEKEIQKLIETRSNEKFKIIFIAVNWEQKGGDIVVKTISRLRNKNIELHVIGAKPEIKGVLPDFIKYHGFLSKTIPEQLQKFTEILSQSHLMFMPSRQEAFGLVLCEANAFAVPVISSSIGGITTIVKNGINGYLYPLNLDIEEIAVQIENLINDRNIYDELAHSSYNEFRNRLNWDVAGAKVKSILQNLY